MEDAARVVRSHPKPRKPFLNGFRGCGETPGPAPQIPPLGAGPLTRARASDVLPAVPPP